MQGIEQIAWQNACRVAISNANRHDEPYVVYRNDEGQLQVGAEATVTKETLYTAQPKVYADGV